MLWIPLSSLHWAPYLLIVTVMAVAGIWICQTASDSAGHHDHGSIVWDEIVGYLIAMIAIPFSFTAMVLGFVLFRLFDIAKPWPISLVDRKVEGGLGIMIDDVLAGVVVCFILHVCIVAGVL